MVSSIIRTHTIFILSGFALLAVSFTLTHNVLLFFLSVALLAFVARARLFSSLAIYLLFSLSTYMQSQPFSPPCSNKNEAILYVESCKPLLDPIERKNRISGKMSLENQKNIPFSCLLPPSKTLIEGATYQGVITIKGYYQNKAAITLGKVKLIKKPFFITALRNRAKYSIRKWIEIHGKDRQAKALYNALLTGEVNDSFLLFYFQKLGLNHLIAISGFHFGILSWALFTILAFFLSKQKVLPLVALFCLFYFIYLGNSPSVFRAFIASLFGLLSQKIHGKVKPLSTLGFALMLELLLHPHHVFSLAFQLSYLATFGIISLYPPLLKAFNTNIPLPYPKIKKILFPALSLNLATTLTTLPVLLFQFQKFPFLSLVYNLYMPFMIFIIMSLLLLSLALAFIPFLSSLIFYLNNTITILTLETLYLYPRKLDFVLYFPHLTGTICILLLALLIVSAMFLLEKTRSRDTIFSHIYGDRSSVG